MDTQKLSDLAERFLNEAGQEEIEVFLERGKVRRAQIYLLGAIDNQREHDKLSDEELASAYSELGLDAVEIADIRNRLLSY